MKRVIITGVSVLVLAGCGGTKLTRYEQYMKRAGYLDQTHPTVKSYERWAATHQDDYLSVRASAMRTANRIAIEGITDTTCEDEVYGGENGLGQSTAEPLDPGQYGFNPEDHEFWGQAWDDGCHEAPKIRP